MFDHLLRFLRYRLQDHAVAFGHAFRMFDDLTIPAGGSVLWSVQLPADQAAVLFDRIISGDQANIRYEVYGAATGVVYGATIPVYNMNPLSARVSGVLFRRLTAGTVSGVIRDLDIVRGSSGPGNASGGSTFSYNDIRVFPNGAEIFVKVTNPSASPAQFLGYLKFFMAPPSLFADVE